MNPPRPLLHRIAAWLGLLAASSALAQGTLVVDQQSGDDSFHPMGSSLTSASIVQSFTPGSNSIGYLQLVFSGENAYVLVNLRSNAYDGPILGSTTPVFIGPGTDRAVTDMYFSNSITLTPGTTYFFQVQLQSGNGVFVGGYNTLFYPGGQAYYNGVASSDDLWFREGIIAPEPGTLALGVVGFGALAYARRRFRKS